MNSRSYARMGNFRFPGCGCRDDGCEGGRYAVLRGAGLTRGDSGVGVACWRLPVADNDLQTTLAPERVTVPDGGAPGSRHSDNRSNWHPFRSAVAPEAVAINVNGRRDF